MFKACTECPNRSFLLSAAIFFAALITNSLAYAGVPTTQRPFESSEEDSVILLAESDEQPSFQVINDGKTEKIFLRVSDLTAAKYAAGGKGEIKISFPGGQSLLFTQNAAASFVDSLVNRILNEDNAFLKQENTYDYANAPASAFGDADYAALIRKFKESDLMSEFEISWLTCSLFSRITKPELYANKHNPQVDLEAQDRALQIIQNFAVLLKVGVQDLRCKYNDSWNLSEYEQFHADCKKCRNLNSNIDDSPALFLYGRAQSAFAEMIANSMETQETQAQSLSHSAWITLKPMVKDNLKIVVSHDKECKPEDVLELLRQLVGFYKDKKPRLKEYHNQTLNNFCQLELWVTHSTGILSADEEDELDKITQTIPDEDLAFMNLVGSDYARASKNVTPADSYAKKLLQEASPLK